MVEEKTYPKTDNLFKVRLFEDADTTKLTDALGITDERASEIGKFCREAYQSSDTVAQAYEKAMDEVKHINEACYAITILSVNHLKNKETSSKIESLLRALKDGLSDELDD